MTEELMRQALCAAADEVINVLADGIPITFDSVPKKNLQWELNFTFGNFFDFAPIPSLTIQEEYGHVPDHELLKAQMWAHLLAHPRPLPQHANGATAMNIHDCGAPLSRRMVRVDRALALELENTSTDTASELHVEEVAFREDWQDGKPTVRIAFGDVASLAPKSKTILKHTTYLFDNYSHTWLQADAGNDRLILLTEKAGAPIRLDVAFVMNETNCWQELGAGQGSDLRLEQ